MACSRTRAARSIEATDRARRRLERRALAPPAGGRLYAGANRARRQPARRAERRGGCERGQRRGTKNDDSGNRTELRLALPVETDDGALEAAGSKTLTGAGAHVLALARGASGKSGARRGAILVRNRAVDRAPRGRRRVEGRRIAARPRALRGLAGADAGQERLARRRLERRRGERADRDRRPRGRAARARRGGDRARSGRGRARADLRRARRSSRRLGRRDRGPFRGPLHGLFARTTFARRARRRAGAAIAQSLVRRPRRLQDRRRGEKPGMARRANRARSRRRRARGTAAAGAAQGQGAAVAGGVGARARRADRRRRHGGLAGRDAGARGRCAPAPLERLGGGAPAAELAGDRRRCGAARRKAARCFAR